MMLFFDLDGPILDVSRKYYQIYADLVVSQGKQPILLAAYWQAKRQRIPDSEILRQSQLENWTSEYQQLRKAQIETPAYLQYDQIWTGMLPLLQTLSAQIPLTLVTLRNSTEALRWQLAALGLSACFQKVLSGSGDRAKDKSMVKVQLVQKALGREAVDAWRNSEEIGGWFIGDTETDIRAGQQLGLKTAAVTFGIRTAEQLQSLCPDRLIEGPLSLIQWLTVELQASQAEVGVQL